METISLEQSLIIKELLNYIKIIDGNYAALSIFFHSSNFQDRVSVLLEKTSFSFRSISHLLDSREALILEVIKSKATGDSYISERKDSEGFFK